MSGYDKEAANALKRLAALFVDGNGQLFNGKASAMTGFNPANSRTSEIRGASMGSSGSRGSSNKKRKSDAQMLSLAKRSRVEAIRELTLKGKKHNVDVALLKQLRKSAKNDKALNDEVVRITSITREQIREAKAAIGDARDVSQLTGIQKKKLAALNITFDEAIMSEDNLTTQIDLLAKQTAKRSKQLTEQMKSAEQQTATPISGADVASGGPGKFTGAISGALDQLLPRFNLASIIQQGGSLGMDTLRAELRTGVGMTGTDALGATMMGMNPDEYMEFSAEFRRTANGFNMTTEQMGKNLRETSLELTNFTGDLKEGMRFQADTMQIFKSMGGTKLGSDFDTFRSSQMDTFKELQRAVNMTATEFRQLTTDLTSSEEARSSMFRMDKQERMVFAASLTKQYARLQLYDLENDAARKVIDSMVAMGAKGPKERLKEAAKAQAMLGAVGMGADAERYGSLVRKGNKRNQSEQIEFENITKRASTATSEMMGGDFVGELAGSALLEKTGMDQYFGPNGSFRELAFREQKTMEEQTAMLKGSNTRLDSIDGTAKALLNTTLVGIAGFNTTAGSMAAQSAIGLLDALPAAAGAIGGTMAGKKLLGGDTDSSDDSSGGDKKQKKNTGKIKSKAKLGGRLGLGVAAASLLFPNVANGAADMVSTLGGSSVNNQTAEPTVRSRAVDATAAAVNNNVAAGVGLASLIPGPQQIPLKAMALGGMAESAYSAAFPEASGKSSQFIGKGIDSMLSMFGNDDAKQRLKVDAAHKADQEAEAQRLAVIQEQQLKATQQLTTTITTMADDIKGLRTDTRQAADATVEATNETTEAVETSGKRHTFRAYRSRRSTGS